MRPKLIIDDKIVEMTPELCAEIFWSFYSDEQARFFNHIGENASAWNEVMQLQYITDEDGLNLAGRRTMQHIGEYSHWGLVPRGNKEFKAKLREGA